MKNNEMNIKRFVDYYEGSEEETFFIEKEGIKTFIFIYRNLDFHTDGGSVCVNGNEIIEGWHKSFEYAKKLGVFDAPVYMGKDYEDEEAKDAYDEAYGALWDEYHK